MHGTITAALLCIFVFLAPPASIAGELGVAATVNGVEISRHRLQKSFEGYLEQRQINVAAIRSPDNYKAMKKEVLDILIGQELLWQDAVDKQIIASDAEVEQALEAIKSEYSDPDSFRRQLDNKGFTEAQFREDLHHRLSVQRLVSSHISKGVTVTNSEVEDFFNSNTQMFLIPEQIHVRHILIKVDQQADDASRAAARTRIEKVRASVNASGDNFADLAKRYSEDSSAADGGDLGISPRGRFVPAFEQAAFSLRVSEVSPIVETQFGFHIIKLEDRQDQTLRPLDEVRPQIRAYLLQPRIQQAIQEYTDRLYDRGQIQVVGHL
jgi:parvulin-like peptidyl-prolyl isomerase